METVLKPDIPSLDIDAQIHVHMGASELDIGLHLHGGDMQGLDVHVDKCTRTYICPCVNLRRPSIAEALNGDFHHETYDIGFHLPRAEHLPAEIDYSRQSANFISSDDHANLRAYNTHDRMGRSRAYTSLVTDTTSASLPNGENLSQAHTPHSDPGPTSLQTRVIEARHMYTVFALFRSGQSLPVSDARSVLAPRVRD